MRVYGPRSNETEQPYCLRAINWTHSLLDECPRPKSGKSRLNLHGTILEGKSIGSDPKKKKKQELKGELMIWRTKMQARVQRKVQLKDSICFK
jgi:hypothetical protein